MEARYPNIPASPSDMYAAYKNLPDVPGGLQALQNIVNQHKNDGLPNGSIALSILNAANQAKAPPPMPQGTVADQVMAQAAPPMDPNMMGLAAPGLEQYAQGPGMATGGLVALAMGGPVQGYSGLDGSDVHFSESPWRPYGETADPIVEDEYDDLPMDVPAVTYADIPVPGHMGGRNFGHIARGEPRSDTARSAINTFYDKLFAASPETPAAPAGGRGPRVGRGGIPAQDVLNQTKEAFKPDLVASRGRGAFAPPAPTGSSLSHIGDVAEALDLANENVSLPYSVKPQGLAAKVNFSSGVPSASPSAASPTVVVDTEDRGIPAAKPPEERTMGGTSSKVPDLSADDQIASLAKFYAGDHSKAAELKGQMEKRLASKENKDLITDIATGLGAMFSGQGTKTQAMGTGLMAFAAQHGRSGEGHDRLQAAIDAMDLQDEAQRNAATHAAAQTVFGARTKSAQQYQDFLYDVYLAKLRNKGWVEREAAKAGSGYDHFSRKQADIDNARNEAWKLTQAHKDFPTMNRTQIESVFRSYLPPDLRDMDIGSPGTVTAQQSYNLPPGYGYTPG